MKFTIVAVILSLTLGAYSSVLPLGLSPLAISHLGLPTLSAGPTLLTSLPATSIISAGQILTQGPAITQELTPSGGIATSIVGPAPGHGLGLLGSPIIAGQGSYVAKTRGAIHTAPLAGHLNSASSINLQPAPGTI